VLEYVVLGDFQTAVAFLLASAPEPSVRRAPAPAPAAAAAAGSPLGGGGATAAAGRGLGAVPRSNGVEVLRSAWARHGPCCSAAQRKRPGQAPSRPVRPASPQVRYYRDVVCTVVLAASATRSNKASPPSLLHIQVRAPAAPPPPPMPPCPRHPAALEPAAAPLPRAGRPVAPMHPPPPCLQAAKVVSAHMASVGDSLLGVPLHCSAGLFADAAIILQEVRRGLRGEGPGRGGGG
jgi:hypothetical protein